MSELGYEYIYRCVGGGQAGADGVCVEHGESACVIGVRVPTAHEDRRHQAPDTEREKSSSTSYRRQD